VTGRYSADRAALGGRTLKTGQSRWFVGYKKHTLRLWIRDHSQQVLLVPLVSWAAPANRGDALFLRPSLAHCERALHWHPDIVVADMAYISLENQRFIREVITNLRADMKLVAPFEVGPSAVCAEGQKLEWLGYESTDQSQWFGIAESNPLCRYCGQQSTCPREFGFAPSEHEILLGLIPLASRPADC
jgi:hypothetical protein